MTLNFEQTQTWSNASKNSGEDLNREFERIYSNTEELYTIIKHRGWGNKRQTTLQGGTDLKGKANFLVETAIPGQIQINASESDPVIFSISSGDDEYGAVEYTVKITENIIPGTDQWPLFTAAGTYFFFIEVNSDTGNVEYGYSSKLPVYSHSRPISPEEGQHWFDLTRFTMNVYETPVGATEADWYKVVRLFIGEVKVRQDTGALDYRYPITYAIRGEYEFDPFYVERCKKYPFLWHNIGTTSITCEVFALDNPSNDSDDANAKTKYSTEYIVGSEDQNVDEASGADSMEWEHEERLRYSDYNYYYGGTGYGMGAVKRIQRNRVIISTGNNETYYYSTSGDPCSDGEFGGGNNSFYIIRVKRTF